MRSVGAVADIDGANDAAGGEPHLTSQGSHRPPHQAFVDAAKGFVERPRSRGHLLSVIDAFT